jgi:competence protein ComEA
MGLLFAAAAGAEPIDINRADAGALIGIKGIGPAKAEAIIAYRDENGPFNSVGDLVHVSGIGPTTVERIRNQITVSSNAAAAQLSTP